MASNRRATSILLDVSKSFVGSQWDPAFLEKSLECIRRLVMKDIFSGGFDLLSLTLFGSDKTSNSLVNDGFYQNVEEVFRLHPPTWDDHRALENIKASSETSSNLLEALTVALDALRRDTAPFKNRVKTRRIIMFTNFASDCDYEEDVLKDLIRSLSQLNVQVIAVGLDFEEATEGRELSLLPGNLAIFALILHGLKVVVPYTFEEAFTLLQYYDKQKKAALINRIDFCIGSKIKIPVMWVKATSEQFKFKWQPRPQEGDRQKDPASASSEMDPAKMVQRLTDVKKRTTFGATQVILTAADCEAMKREESVASFQYLGCTKRKRIKKDMLVGNKFYVVLPDDRKPKSHPHFAAFVDALIEMDHVALCRRILVKNGKVYLGVLLPVSDKNGKAFYFHQLPRKEWTQSLPTEEEVYKSISGISLEEEKAVVRDFVRSRTLPKDVFSKGNGVMVRDPYFQHICNLMEQKALNKLSCREVDIPEHILKIINPISRSGHDGLSKILRADATPKNAEESKEQIKNSLEAFEATKDLLDEESKNYIIENNRLIPQDDLLKALGRSS